MGVDGGNGWAPQTVPHLLNIGAARRERNLDRLRRPLLQTKKREFENFILGPSRRERTSTSWTPPTAGTSSWRRVCKGGWRNDSIIPPTLAQKELQQILDLLAGSIQLLMQLAKTEASGWRMNQIIRAALPGGDWEWNRDRKLLSRAAASASCGAFLRVRNEKNGPALKMTISKVLKKS
jgi:hypothetical protein